MRLGLLIEELKKERQSAWLLIDKSPVSLAPTGEVDSYRGYYEQLAVAVGPARSSPTKVSDLLAILQDAIGKTFTGYKGGEFRMHEGTPVWLGNYGECGTLITGLRAKGEGIVYLTWVED